MKTVPSLTGINPNLTDQFPEDTNGNNSPPRRWLNVLTPAQCREWQMPEGYHIAGEFHIVRGDFTVIGGPAGLGKSRAAHQLAISGATGEDWFGLPVHQQFKTFILQNENGAHRLKTDFADVSPELDDFIRITPPPEYGLRFDNPEFRAQLKEELEQFQPAIVVIDPLTNIVRDSAQSDYSDAFNFIRESLPTGDNAPAVVLVAHTRKPKGERASGVALNHELLGSTKLGSVPRSVFVMQPASNDTTDNRIVWTCSKNNDGEKGPRTAWHRENGLFRPCLDLDWGEFENPPKGIITITEQIIADLFHGRKAAAKKVLVADLIEQTGCGHSAAYNALKLGGRFAEHLQEQDGLLTWKP